MLRAALAALLLTAAPAAAAPGSLDRSFGRHGRIAIAVGDESYANTVRLDSAGRVLLGGFAATPGDNALAVARLTPQGRLDPRFGQGGIATPDVPGATLFNGATRALLPAPQGTAIAVGDAEDSYNEAQHVVIARLDPRGELDPRFGQGGATVVTRPGAFYFSVAGAGRDAGGRILALASARPVNGRSTAVLIRVRADGTPDTSFGPGGMVTLARGVTAAGLLVNRDGSAIGLGTIPARGKRPVRAVVYRLDARGHVRSSRRLVLIGRHASDGVGATALARGRHGSVFVAGNDTAGFTGWAWVARLRRDGRWERRVIPVAKRRNFTVSALVRDRRGRIVAAGSLGYDLGRSYDAAAVRLLPDGRVDRRFGVVVRRLGSLAHVHLISSGAGAAAIDRRGRIVLVGAAWDDDIPEKEDLGNSYFAAARLNGRP